MEQFLKFQNPGLKCSTILSYLYQTGCQLPYGPRCEKTCLRGFANDKDADQPVHPRSLISVFVICFSESNIPKLATNKISMFCLVSVAEQAGMSLTWLQTPKTGFVATMAHMKCHKSDMLTNHCIFSFFR